MIKVSTLNNYAKEEIEKLCESLECLGELLSSEDGSDELMLAYQAFRKKLGEELDFT